MNYHKIEKTSVANGTGVRVVLWVSGCSLHCRGCHNPETWSVESGKRFDYSAKDELFDALSKSYIQGITFSGGHPLEVENITEVYSLCKEIKEKYPEKDIWLYTGYTFEDVNTYPIMQYIDVLVDGRYIESQKDITLKWRGSRNQRVIDVKKTFQRNEIILYEVE